MPRATETKQYRDFTAGLNTDSSPLNMPENTVTDILDMVIEKSGKVKRSRHSVEASAVRDTGELSSGHKLISSSKKTSAYVWKAPNGEGDTSFAVVRVAGTLMFYDLNILSDDIDVEAGYIGQLSLSTVLTSSSYVNETLQFSSGQGKLFIANKFITPSYISWDGATTFTVTPLNLRVRDFNRVDDGLGIDGDAVYSGDQFLFLTGVTGTYSVAETVTEGGNSGTVVSWDATNSILRVTATNVFTLGATVTGGTSGATGSIQTYTPVMADYVSDSKNNHLYNLINQGWTPTEITKYTVERGVEPDNTKVWVLGKDTSDVFDPVLLDKQHFGTGLAPNGSAIISPFLRDRQSYITFGGHNVFTVGGTATVDTTTDGTRRPSTTTFAFGRVWWAGTDSDINSNKVLFSQVLIEDPVLAGRCYQQQDPTAEDFNALLATDGGELVISDAGTIKKIVPFRSGVLAFSTTGVWYISGGQSGFTPTDVNVSKITSEGVLGEETVVVTPQAVLYWSSTGIIAITLSEDTISLQVTNISENRINNYYLNKSESSATGTGSALFHHLKYDAKGVFDEHNNRILWGYGGELFLDNPSFMKSALVYDIDLQSFYRISLPSTPYEINTAALISKEGYGIKYLNSNVDGTNVFVNWGQLQGSSYTGDGHIETFYETLGDSSRKKNALWVVTHFERTEDGYEDNGSGGVILSNQSGCQMRAKWDWTDDNSANKWSSQQQVYRLRRVYIPASAATPFDYGYTVISTKNKVRGHGKAVQFRFDTETDKDLILLGWDVTYEGNSSL